MRYLKYLLLLLMVVGAHAQTNILYVRTGDPQSGSGNPNLKALKVVLSDTTENPRVINGIFISPQTVTHYTLTNGIAYFTNVVWGTYNIRLAASPEVAYDIQVETNTSGLTDAATLTSITNQPNPLSEFYTKSQVDAFFADFTGGVSLVQLLSASNSLQSQITSGGATTLVVTSIVNSATGVIANNGTDLTFKFSSTGTNAVQSIAQPLVNAASNTLAASSAALGVNLTNAINNSSNLVVGTSQAAINNSSNSLYNTLVGGGGSGNGFPLTVDGNGNGKSITNLNNLTVTVSVVLPSALPANTNAAISATNMTQWFNDNTLDIGPISSPGATNLFGVGVASNGVQVAVGNGLLMTPNGPNTATLSVVGVSASALVDTNFYLRSFTVTNLLDVAKAQTFDIGLLTNAYVKWTNVNYLTNLACHDIQVNLHQWTNGGVSVMKFLSASGIVTTNAPGYTETTNANTTDILIFRTDGTKTNLVLSAITNCSTYVDTNSLLAGGGGGGGSPIIAGSQVYFKDDNNTGNTSSDASGNGADMTLSGSTLPAWSSPYIGVASLFFDGTTSFMTNQPSASYSPDSSDATLTVWIKTTTKPHLGVVWGMVNVSSGRYFMIEFTSNGFIDGAAQGGGGPSSISANGQDYSDGAWHFVVCEYDHTAGTVSLWVDNVSIGTAGATGTPLSIGTVSMVAGQFGSNGGFFYQGFADEHALYPSLLNGTDRTSLFGQGHP